MVGSNGALREFKDIRGRTPHLNDKVSCLGTHYYVTGIRYKEGRAVICLDLESLPKTSKWYMRELGPYGFRKDCLIVNEYNEWLHLEGQPLENK